MSHVLPVNYLKSVTTQTKIRGACLLAILTIGMAIPPKSCAQVGDFVSFGTPSKNWSGFPSPNLFPGSRSPRFTMA
jgi:hypothetical protein